MAKESRTDRIKETIKDLKRVRNIGIAAHIDHGKCIDGKSRILLADGNFITADEIFNSAASSGRKIKENENETVYDISHHNIQIYSLNKRTAKIEKKAIQYAWKLKGGNLLNVTLRNGLSISTTPEHKYIAFNGAAFVEKEAGYLTKGDRIVCSRCLDVDTNPNLKKEMLSRLACSGNFYVHLNKKYGTELKKRILEYGIDKLVDQKVTSTSLSAKNIYHGSWKNRYNLTDILRLGTILNTDAEEIYDNIDTISYRTGKKEGRSSISIKLPENFEDFFYLAGLLAGDGSGTKLVAGKIDLAEKFSEICRDLGMEPYWRKYEGKCPEICSGGGKTLFMILNILFGYPEKQKSRNIFASEFLKKSQNKCVGSFLRAYFDCDGTVEHGRRAISINSASERMLKDLQLLLLRFGCISIRQGDTLYISGDSIRPFTESIGFFLKDKQEKMNILLKTTKGSLVSDTIPVNRQKIAELRAGMPKARFGHHYYKYESNIYTPTIETFGSIMSSFEDAGIDIREINKFMNRDLAFIEIKEIKECSAKEVFDFSIPENHNFIAEGMVIHNTTLTDNLLAGAGMLSEELAGKAVKMDFDKQEQERGITIYAGNVSMVYDIDGTDYVVNLIDTPGHVDFGGDVTRAMRAVDGAIVVVCAVEGAMPQTETVLRQALRERVKPLLFINKVDRLIRELKLTPEQIMERFTRHITDVNALIRKYAPPELKEDWLIDVQSGKVAFGSAYRNWATSVPHMKKTGVSFKEIIDCVSTDREKELAKRSKIHEALLDMVIKHHPNPAEAQKYRIPRIWTGDISSPEGQSMINADKNGETIGVITNVTNDPNAGIVSTVRMFSGTIKDGQTVHLVGAHTDTRIQQVSVFDGPKRVHVGEMCVGNIIAVTGLDQASSGETICNGGHEIATFEEIKHIFEPVVTKSIEVKNIKDLAKLVEVLRMRSKEDPTLRIKISEETGETLVSGLGELHIEAKIERYIQDKGIPITVSKPIVIYKESVVKDSEEFEGKTPNRHNRFYVKVAPLSDEVRQVLISGNVPEGKIRKQDQLVVTEALSAVGFDRDEARKVVAIQNGNLLINATRGIVQLNEVIELIIQSFKEVCSEGPLASEPVFGIKIMLTDAKLHEDAIHRGPAQVLPAVKMAIKNSMLDGKASLFEPKQIVRIDCPSESMGSVVKEVQNRRGQIMNMEEEQGASVITAKLPVSEMFGFEAGIKSATGGRGFQSLIDIKYERLPSEIQDRTVLAIRKRKGMKEELPQIRLEP